MSISVYVLDITRLLDRDVLVRYMALASPKRREKAACLKNTADKARCIGAGILLAHAYNHYQNIQRESAGAGSLVVFSFSGEGVLHMCGMSGETVRKLKQGDGLTNGLLEELEQKLPEKLSEELTEKIQKKLPEELIGEGGKPYFAEGPCFNLSHAGNKVVCVMASFEVGVDVECVRPCKDAVMTRCFTQEEIASVRAAGQNAQEEIAAVGREGQNAQKEIAAVKTSKAAGRKEERNTDGETGSSAGCKVDRNQESSADRVFTEIWTQKEARAKLSGKGIADIFHMRHTGQDLTVCVHTIWLDEDYVLSVAADLDEQLWQL